MANLDVALERIRSTAPNTTAGSPVRAVVQSRTSEPSTVGGYCRRCWCGGVSIRGAPGESGCQR